MTEDAAALAPALSRTTFRELPVFPYDGWWSRVLEGRLEGGPIFPADAPDWVHMPMHRGTQWLRASVHPKPDTLLRPIEGRHFFVGPTVHHFGHMVGEFLHRVWVLREDPSLVPLLVLGQRQPPRIPGFVHEYLRLIGASPPVLVDRPSLVQELVVGEPGRVLHRPADPDYARLIGNMLPAALLAPRGQARDLALLRGHIQTGRCIGEPWIEEVLSAQGYRLFRPESHSLEDQIAAIMGAERIVCSEGSALHLFDLLPPIKGRVAVIGRRPAMGMVKACLAGKVEAPVFYHPRFLIGSLAPGGKRAQALSFIDPDEALELLAAERFLTKIPPADFFTEPGVLEADIGAYVAHWGRQADPATTASFSEAALASCRARRQDPGLAASLSKVP